MEFRESFAEAKGQALSQVAEGNLLLTDDGFKLPRGREEFSETKKASSWSSRSSFKESS